MNIVLVILQIIVSIILLFFPLSEYFSYEYSLVSAVFVSVFSLLKTVSNLRKEVIERSKENENISFLRKMFNSVNNYYLLIGIIPFLIGVVNAIIRGDCPFEDGILFYILFAIPAISVGRGIAAIASFFSLRFSYVFSSVIWLVIVLIPIGEIYYYPQVYFYNPILSYFPGNIYDESIVISSKLIFYRISVFLFFESLFFAYKQREKISSFLFNLLYPTLAISISLLFLYLSPYLRLSTNQYVLENILTEKIKTENFEIYLHEGLNKKQKMLIANLHEFYFDELQKFYKTKPKKKIVSFIFDSKEEKGRLFGAENADVAKPWLYQIYISKGSLESTLKHEISHIFTAEFASGIFKVADSFNPLLIEGIAMASDPFYDYYDIDFLVNTAYQNGYKISIKNLFSGFSFFSNASSVSYLYSGVFINFLIKNYGINKVKLFYSDADFLKYFGKDISALEKDFVDYLATNKDYTNKLLADYYFGRKGLLQKACPRYLAKGIEEIYSLISAKQYSKAFTLVNKYENLFENHNITNSKIVLFEKVQAYEDGIDLLSKKSVLYKNTSFEYYFLLRLGDFYQLIGDSVGSDSIYKTLTYDNKIRGYYFAAQVREVLKDSTSSITDYIKGNNEEKLVILLNLYKEAKSFLLIPSIIELMEKVNINIDIKVFKNEELIKVVDSFVLFTISKYFTNNLDTKNALEYINLAIQRHTDNISIYRLEEHKRFVEYLIKNEKRV